MTVNFYRHEAFELGAYLYVPPKEYRERRASLSFNLGRRTLDLTWRLR